MTAVPHISRIFLAVSLFLLYYKGRFFGSQENLVWIDEQIKRFKSQKLPVTFDPHLFVREAQRNFEICKVVETVKTGKIIVKKSVEPRKICFNRYFGKENKTYVVIAIFHKNYVEVKTARLKKGR